MPARRTTTTGWRVAGGLLAACLATAAAASQSAAVELIVLPDWLVLGPPQPATGLPAAWEGVTRAAMPYLDATPSAAEMATRGWVGAAALPPFVELTVSEGEYAGLWRFHAHDGEDQPRAAWRLRLSEAPPYRVTAQLYCDAATDGCMPLQRELAQLAPPRPTQQATVADWLRIITGEPCEPGPVRTPAPDFPPQALRNGIAGTVGVLVAFNACGDVRHASVYQSSRDASLDRAAVRAARSWRVAPPEGTVAPGQAVVRVSFRIPDDIAPSE
jgi:TonB family protein